MRFHPEHLRRSDRRRERAADVDPRLFEQLAPGEAAPDLTARIMNRLGYVKVTSDVARRRRRRRFMLRGFAGIVALTLVAIGVEVHHHGPDARRPTGPTLQEAFSNDIDRHQQSFIRTIQTIQQLAPADQRDAADEDTLDHQLELDEDVDRSAVGPVRWL